MKPAFYYIVRVKLIRSVKNETIDFITDEKIFKDKNPIVAREKALSYYNSYIDTILEQNLSHNEIKEKLFHRLGGDKTTTHKLVILNKFGEEVIMEHTFRDAYFNGIGVILKIETPIDDIFGDELFIHGVGFGGNGDSQPLMDSLTSEIEYYTHFKYDTKNYKTTIKFYEYDGDEVYDEVILKTPFDWTGYDVPESDDSQQEQDTSEHQTIGERKDLFSVLIRRGETNIVEFKSSLVAYKNEYNQIGYSRHVKFRIAKTIASFLNSSGGVLFIGVKDDQSILGLESDFSLAQSKINNPKDYFRIEVDRILKEHFKSVANSIAGEFIEFNDKSVYAFIIEPSPKPIFIMNKTDRDESKHKKEFYVRLAGASSVIYTEIDEIVDYCLNNWNKKE